MEDLHHEASGDVSQGSAEGKTDFVKHSTYARAIDEVKTFKSKYRDVQAELNEYREKEKALAESRLLEEKKFQELITQQKTEIDALKQANDHHIKDKMDFRKFNAAMSVMQSKGINLDSQYMSLIPIDDIGISDEGDIDLTSVASVVDDFQKAHPRLTMPIKGLLPNDSSHSNSQKMSVEQWKKLPKEEKYKALKDKKVKFPY